LFCENELLCALLKSVKMYTYERKRSEYGKQCRFYNHGPTVMINMMPDRSLEKDWIQKNPVDKTTNETNKWSEHDVYIFS